jgi:molecular chaperone GrpE
MTEPEAAEERPQDEVADLKSRLAELENRWRSTAADFDNFRKRTARDAEQLGELERARAAGQWLPVLDNLDMALAHADADPASIVEGLRAVREQAGAVMARLGFARREDEPGTPFDPAVHDAVSTAPGEPGTIVAVVRPGYGSAERPLRPAAVVVARQS